jgi:BON domain
VSSVPACHTNSHRRRRRYDLSLLGHYSRDGWPCRPTDQSIEWELKEALTWSSSGIFSAVHVRVREGTVFLTGEVTDFDSFRSLDALVAVTPGVRYVKNGVLVIPEEEHEPPLWVGEK